MGLPYHPKVGEVLWCDYKNLVPPEMEKKRLAIVISPKFINRTDLCTVVPISTTAPKVAQNYHHRLEADPLPTSPEGTVAWAKCDMVMTVSFGRLSGWWGEKKDGKEDEEEDAAVDAAADAEEAAAAAAGGGAGAVPHKGAIHLYSYHQQPKSAHVEIKKRADGCTSIAWINDIKFSPNGRILAAGSHDKRLYAFDIPEISSGDASSDGAWEGWKHCLEKVKYEFNKHSSAVLHVDFSVDGRYFQTNCQAAELLFGVPDSGKQETSATKVADYNGQLEDDPELEGRVWATQTCKLGWAVQGIWAPGSDTTDINAVDRNPDGKLLATADDFGHVKLFRFPCAVDAAKHATFYGHSSHVTNVRWTAANNQLLSVGGNDKCVFVWNMTEK